MRKPFWKKWHLVELKLVDQPTPGYEIAYNLDNAWSPQNTQKECVYSLIFSSRFALQNLPYAPLPWSLPWRAGLCRLQQASSWIPSTRGTSKTPEARRRMRFGSFLLQLPPCQPPWLSVSVSQKAAPVRDPTQQFHQVQHEVQAQATLYSHPFCLGGQRLPAVISPEELHYFCTGLH